VGLLRGAGIINLVPGVGYEHHLATCLLQLLLGLERLQLLPSVVDPLESYLGLDVHVYLDVGDREDHLDYLVYRPAELLRHVCGGQAVPDEDHVVVLLAMLPLEPERPEDIQDVEQSGYQDIELPVPAEVPLRGLAECGPAVGVGYLQYLPAFVDELLANEIGGGGLTRTVHPIHGVPCHRIRAPEGS
jgi:hypothetical protein